MASEGVKPPEELTDPQRQVLLCLNDKPERAVRGGPWSPIAAFNLVWPGYVKLHQSFAGDRYSLTKKGAKLAGLLRARAATGATT